MEYPGQDFEQVLLVLIGETQHGEGGHCFVKLLQIVQSLDLRALALVEVVKSVLVVCEIISFAVILEYPNLT